MSDAGRMRSNPAYEACVAVLDTLRIPHRVEHGGRHPKLIFEFRGKTLRKTLASTPGDRVFGPDKAAADVRRMIRKVERERPRKAPGEANGLATRPLPAPSRDQLRTETMQAISEQRPNSNRPIVFLHDGEVRANSRDVADQFGKRHDHVLRDIDNLLINIDSPKLGSAMFIPMSASDGQGIQRRAFEMNRDGFSLLAMGFTGSKALQWKLLYIEAFNRMEAELFHRPAGEISTLTAEARKEIGGIVKSVIGKALEDVVESQLMMAQGLAALSEHVDSISVGAGPAIAVAESGMITAYEVVGMAEVPQAKRYNGLYSYVSKELQKHCGRNGYRTRLVNLMPGERWEFQREGAVEWSEAGGRKVIWEHVNAYADRKKGQGVIKFPRKDQAEVI